MALHSKGVKAKSFSASQISMRTTSSYSKAKILDVDAKKILDVVENDTIPIITGFQGVTEGGDVTTLGRGGSDTTAVAIAAQIAATRCDIFTDVDGILYPFKNCIILFSITFINFLMSFFGLNATFYSTHDFSLNILFTNFSSPAAS